MAADDRKPRRRWIHVCFLAIVTWLVFEHFSRSRLAPPKDVTTFPDFLRWRPNTARVLVVSANGREYLCALGPKAGVLPSGPSAYVFDDNGVLQDWTADAGDDPRFREKWSFDRPVQQLAPDAALRRTTSEDAAPAPRPVEQTERRVECSVRAFTRDEEWVCQVTLVNHTRELVKAPRGPRSIFWSPVKPPIVPGPSRPLPDGGVQHSFSVRGGGGWSVNHVGEVPLLPDEGYIRIVKIGSLEPGEYKLDAQLPAGFRRWNPQPVSFTVPPPPATQPVLK